MLFGKTGATHTFGKQKGIADDQLNKVDEKIKTFADLCNNNLNKNCENVPGVGAAGGVGFALATFLDAKLVSGAELILDTIEFDKHLNNADIVIVGEGKMDKQSLCGKIPVTVAQKAKSQNVKKVIAIVGSYELKDTDLNNSAIDAIFSCITHYTDLETILAHAAENIEQTANNIAKIIRL